MLDDATITPATGTDAPVMPGAPTPPASTDTMPAAEGVTPLPDGNSEPVISDAPVMPGAPTPPATGTDAPVMPPMGGVTPPAGAPTGLPVTPAPDGTPGNGQ